MKIHWHGLCSNEFLEQRNEETLRKLVIWFKNIEEPMSIHEQKDICLVVLEINFYQVLEQALKTSQK